MIKNFLLRAGTAIIGLIGLYSAYTYLPIIVSTSMIFGILLWILYKEWPQFITEKTIYITPFYPIAPCIILMYFNSVLIYRPLLVLMCITTFTHDSAGYIFGSLLGKNLLAPQFSPKKTVEGLIAGYICTFIILLTYVDTIDMSNIFPLFLLSFGISTCATAGDLFESYLKRSCKIKDSGSLLPGHGGLLDRIDALLFVAVLFYIIKNSIQHIL